MATDEEVRLIIKATTEDAVKKIAALNKGFDNTVAKGNKLKTGLANLKKSWLGLTVAIAGAAVIVKKVTDAAGKQEEAEYNEHCSHD